MNTALAASVAIDSSAAKLSYLYRGIHPQEDRDTRVAARAAGTEKKSWSMIRIRVPLGILTDEQYLALDRLANRATYNRSLRVTAGQSIQLHGIQSHSLEFVVDEIERIGLAAGCHESGLEYAVALPPAPLETESYRRLRALAIDICDELYPKPGITNRSYPEHAPRKFAIGLGLPEDNTVNVVANDVGLMLVVTANGESRVNVFAGGGLSMPGRRAETYARLASSLGSVRPDQVVPVLKAISAVFARHGHLATRRHTRLKYLVDEMGTATFRREVEREVGFLFSDAVPSADWKIPSSFGPNEQANGEWFYGVAVPYGRIQDAGIARYKSAIRLIVEALQPSVILSPDQNIIFSGLRRDQIEPLERILGAFHIPFGKGVTRLRYEAMACAGLPTCPLAVAESERVAGPILDELERELVRIGKENSSFSFRISGCSIGCIRPNMVDLGAIGRKPGHYDLYIGGSEAAGRFGELFAESVPLAEIVSNIRPVLEAWGTESDRDESFGEFYARCFGTREKPQRLVSYNAFPARERVERRMLAQK